MNYIVVLNGTDEENVCWETKTKSSRALCHHDLMSINMGHMTSLQGSHATPNKREVSGLGISQKISPWVVIHPIMVWLWDLQLFFFFKFKPSISLSYTGPSKGQAEPGVVLTLPSNYQSWAQAGHSEGLHYLSPYLALRAGLRASKKDNNYFFLHYYQGSCCMYIQQQ